jgi:putative Ca2+/H+ antiporter (TMEM165/GDT1 family)
MASALEVLGTAFLLQLLALPGEKGQLVVAALATRYDPYRVVAGAATAFGAWTAIEILVGEALVGVLPEGYLDALTAALFVGFAAVILYSQYRDAPASDAAGASTDGGSVDGASADAPGRLGTTADAEGGYLAALSAMGVAEFGDKTQLVTVGLAVQYGARPAIWVGEMLAIVPVSLLVALVFHRTARLLNRAWVHYLAAGTFLLFAGDIVAEYAFGVSALPL